MLRLPDQTPSAGQNPADSCVRPSIFDCSKISTSSDQYIFDPGSSSPISEPEKLVGSFQIVFFD